MRQHAGPLLERGACALGLRSPWAKAVVAKSDAAATRANIVKACYPHVRDSLLPPGSERALARQQIIHVRKDLHVLLVVLG